MTISFFKKCSLSVNYPKRIWSPLQLICHLIYCEVIILHVCTSRAIGWLHDSYFQNWKWREMQWNSDVLSLLAWTQNPISYIPSQCDLAHSPVLHIVVSIYKIVSAIAWIVLLRCSISRSIDWIICRLFIILHYIIL